MHGGVHRSGNACTPRVARGCDGAQRAPQQVPEPSCPQRRRVPDRHIRIPPLWCPGTLQGHSAEDGFVAGTLMESGWWRGCITHPPSSDLQPSLLGNLISGWPRGRTHHTLTLALQPEHYPGALGGPRAFGGSDTLVKWLKTQ